MERANRRVLAGHEDSEAARNDAGLSPAVFKTASQGWGRDLYVILICTFQFLDTGCLASPAFETIPLAQPLNRP